MPRLYSDLDVYMTHGSRWYISDVLVVTVDI
jgi:hypothetical protein